MTTASSSVLPDIHAQPARVPFRPALLSATAVCGPAVLGLLTIVPELDLRYQSALSHFWIVTAAALVAIGLAVLMLRVGVVRQDGRVLLVGAGFMALSTIFLIHAVATPNVVFTNTGHASAWSTPIALTVGAIVLAASTIERLAQGLWIVHRWRWWMSAGTFVWVLYAGFMLVYVPHDALQAQHLTDTQQGVTLQQRMMALAPSILPPLYTSIICLYATTAWRYGQRLRHTPTRPLLAMTMGTMLLAQTALAAYVGTVWHLSFWLYHALLLAGVSTVAYGVLIGYGQTGSLSSMVEGLFLRSTLHRQRQDFHGAMTTLLGALETSNETQLPELRGELRQRFALAEDQLDLLQHAVQAVAKEREEQQRFRALAEVSRAATLNLDPHTLLSEAVTSFVETTGATTCAVGLLDDANVSFAPEHVRRHDHIGETVVTIPCSALPAAMFTTEDALLIGLPGQALAPLAMTLHPILVLPLRHHERVLGVLVVQPKVGALLDERVITVCRSISAHLATALANAQLHQTLQRKHERLQQSEQAREQLAQMVIHDLKNPLTSINGFLSLIHMTPLTPEQREFVHGAQRGSHTMMRLINDMLDLARLEEGRLDLHCVSSNIEVLLQECRDELRPWAEQSNKQINVVAAPMPEVLLDTNLLRRVLINLLSNALKHTPPGTLISLRAERDQSVTHISIHDTGPGIPADRVATLFDRFVASADQQQEQSNTGLGLTFCKLAVEAHGGTITVHSTATEGTTFTITLPLDDA